jgi:hypothetical protein
MKMNKLMMLIGLLVIGATNLMGQTHVQQRLNQGESPKQLFDSGVILDSLYGKTYGGGLIFYLDTIYGKGMVSALSNQSNGMSWGCYGNVLGASADTIGGGANNTSQIVAGCPTLNIAARICDTLQFNGFSDWFLPSKDELFLMRKNLQQKGYGGFSNMTYWTSTEESSTQAWYLGFSNGLFNTGSKAGLSYVRAARAFDGPQILQITPQVCIVGVDSNGFNRVIWERDGNPLYDSVYIYKEGSSAGVYNKIGSKAYASQGIFTDSLANPMVMAYRYKISVIDTFGMESIISQPHKTIHLSINAGLNNTWNLIWSHYEGFNFSNYNIYRGSDSTLLTLLTIIQSNLNSYTDLNPPIGDVYYLIEVESPHPCYPDSVYAKANTNYNISRSNNVHNSINPSIEKESYQMGDNSKTVMYPIPLIDGKLMIQLNESLSGNLVLSLYNNIGQLVYNDIITVFQTKVINCTINNIPAGQYYINLVNDDQIIYKGKVIIK